MPVTPMSGGRTLLIAGALAALAAVATALAAHASQPAGPYDKPGQLVALQDGRRIDLRCSGRGSRVVLLEGGYLATSAAWTKVQPEIARFTRVCAYDRAGYGFSDPGPAPRDGASVAGDLDQALRSAAVMGPFVLVGHSAGGLYVRLFAQRRAHDIAGMVLVDPSVPHQDRRFNERFGSGDDGTRALRDKATACLAAAEAGRLPSTDARLASCTPKPGPGRETALAQAIRPSTWQTAQSEAETLWNATSDEVDRSAASYGAMPLVVLTADGTYAGLPPGPKLQVDAYWRDLHREVAAKSSRGQERLVSRSSHMMMFDRPDAIVSAVKEVVTEARAGGR